MSCKDKIKFAQPVAFKAVDENKVDEYRRVFVNPHAEWFDEISMSVVGSMFLPVYFLDWLNSQLSHGTFHKEATVYAVFCLEKGLSNGDSGFMFFHITSEYSPFGRTTSLHIKDIDFSALMYRDKIIYSWGNRAPLPAQAGEYIRCMNAVGDNMWVATPNVLRKENGRPVLFSTGFIPCHWDMLTHVLMKFEEVLQPYRQIGGLYMNEKSRRELLDLIKFKRDNGHSSVDAMREQFGFFDLLMRTYRMAIKECDADDSAIFVERQWIEIIDRLAAKLFHALHRMQIPELSTEVKDEKI